jgi:hypothetical protein
METGTKKATEIVNFRNYRIDMKGVSYITNSKNRKTAVVIDLKTLEKFDDQIEDLFDVIIAESRKGESTVSWEQIKKNLQKKGKL